MPLVVPGVTSVAANSTEEWQNKLVGKKLSETATNETEFCKKDLPKEHRIISPGTMVTKDHNEKRLNTSSSIIMFKKEISPSPKQKLKSSVQRTLRQSLQTTYPLLARHMDEILPKKASLESMKLPDRNTLYVLDGEPLFFKHDGGREAPMPHLRLVHRFPRAFPSVRIDRGAIRFVLSGATLMAPGLTSSGGRLPLVEEEERSTADGDDGDGRWRRELVKGEPVVVMAEGKTEACAVGVLLEGTEGVKAKGKGPVIEDAHFLGDGLWKLVTC
ncbi:hypothetical protein L249_8665 [Ophiocordyceps polyrhachis-furcata BCC 54312]|uniref:Pre-PUA domain-containing protein n=1 Tax=Ophiocordyceps polyrhachis-furcata BCC 54312 TaxID=1330021 RepID=A0A367L6Z8_9HYPO|nr:hypothetical protein L249_8665 [Ophiocordyceps polyrhachis-furcata BCC 54312]